MIIFLICKCKAYHLLFNAPVVKYNFSKFDENGPFFSKNMVFILIDGIFEFKFNEISKRL